MTLVLPNSYSAALRPTRLVLGRLLFACLLLPIAAAAEQAPLWQPLTPLPVGVAGFGVRASQGSLEVAGGTTWREENKETLALRWRWSAADGQWRPLPPLPEPRAHGAFTAVPRGLVLAGGSDGVTTRADVVLVDSTNRIQTTGRLPEPSAYAGAAVLGEKLFILGGTPDLNDLPQLRPRFQAIDLRTGTLEVLPAYPPGPVMHARLAAVGGRILVFPGGGYDATHRRAENRAEVWSYEVKSQRWSQRRDYPFPVRGLAVCALDGTGHVFTAGGYRSAAAEGEAEVTAECFLYDADHDVFHPLPPVPYAAMLMEAASDGEWVYVMGGEDRARHRAPHAYRARIADGLMSARR